MSGEAFTAFWSTTTTKLGADKIAAELHWSVQMFEEVTGLRATAPVDDSDDVIALSERRRLRA